MGRSPCCEKVGLRKGTWTPEEDQKLLTYIEQHSHGSWRALPAKAGLQRCGKSCRLRWTNYLRPDIKRGKFSLQEEQTIIQLHALLGNRWSAIATHLAKRTDNEIKNYWNTHLKKRLTKMGIDPSTHKPKINPLIGSGQPNKDTANLSHMAQWESARLEAESRLVRESKLMIMPHHHQYLRPSVQSFNKTSSSVAAKVPPQLDPLMVLPCLDVLKAATWQGTWKTTSSTTNAFFNHATTGTLQSPTSTLHFSDSVFAAAACIGDHNIVPFSGISYIESPPKPLQGGITKENGPNNDNNMNSAGLQLNDDDDHLVNYPIDDTDYFGDSLRTPSFMEGFVGADDGQNLSGTTTVPILGAFESHGSSSTTTTTGGGAGGDLEDNKKYWNNILNVEESASNLLLSNHASLD